MSSFEDEDLGDAMETAVCLGREYLNSDMSPVVETSMELSRAELRATEGGLVCTDEPLMTDVFDEEDPMVNDSRSRPRVDVFLSLPPDMMMEFLLARGWGFADIEDEVLVRVGKRA